jgi:hypothetical protein
MVSLLSQFSAAGAFRSSGVIMRPQNPAINHTSLNNTAQNVGSDSVSDTLFSAPLIR